MLAELRVKVNEFWEKYRNNILIAVAVFLMGMIGFGLVRLSILLPEKTSLRVVDEPISAADTKSSGQACSPGGFCGKTAKAGEASIVASKQGSAYYLPWCSNSIKNENKIYFKTEPEAEKAGYALAKNCSR